jgi:hypothetical protein
MLGGVPLPEPSIQRPISAQWQQRLGGTSAAALTLIPVTVVLVVAAISDWFGLRILFAAQASAAFVSSMT